jgi:hypothetical protein
MSKKTKPTTPAFIQMSFDNWVETFDPISNTITPDAPFDGSMFETYGDDLSAVLVAAHPANGLKVWTLVEGDEGQYVVDGYRLVNRIGYFITNKPAAAGTEYEIAV